MPKSRTTFFASTINYYRNFNEGLEILISSAPTNNYYRCLRERLETLTSSAPTYNYCRGFREGFKTQLVFTTSTSFVNGFDIPDVTPSGIKPAKTGYTFWRGYCQNFRIKDPTLAAHSLCKYTWKVTFYMILISERYLGPDIWPETLDQAENIEDMMRIVWAEEAKMQVGLEPLYCPPPARR